MNSPDINNPNVLHLPASHERRAAMAGDVGGRALDLAHVPRLTGDGEIMAGLKRLKDHMFEIAADPSGSDPAPYLSPETLDTIAEFKTKPAAERWRGGGAIPLTHDDMTFHWTKRRTINTPITDGKGGQLMGRRVGYLNAGQFETPVLYCSDDKLRMLIKTTGSMHGRAGHGKKSHSTYVGYCRLPDPEILLPVLSRGEIHPVSYKHQQSKTLKGELGLKN